MLSHSLAFFLAVASLAAAQKIQFDGRVPAGTPLSFFDSKNNLFGSTNVLGKNLTFSKVLLLPNMPGSIFDSNTVPLEVTISDQSIFAPSADNVQVGFRRAELNPASNNGSDASTLGVKTLHFSIMKDAQRPLNLSHEYQVAFLESKDFSTNQVVLKTGTILGQTPPTADPDTLQLFGNVASKNVSVLFSTTFTPGVFHNFGLTLDFDRNTTQVFYSAGGAPLQQATPPVANDVAGQGQYHFGLLKKPVGGGADITKSGFQPAGISEGLIFAGIFEEDSAGGVVTKSLAGAGAANSTTAVAQDSSCKSRSVSGLARRVRRGM